MRNRGKQYLFLSVLVPVVLGTAILLSGSISIAWASGPTYVRDAVSVSTEWGLVGSPYILQNNVTVQKGAILTIDPGVTVEFMAQSGQNGSGPNLIIQGGLKAIGNPMNPISFGPAVAGSLWGALYFFNADSPNCVLQACLVKGGSVICNGTSPVITGCALYGSKIGLGFIGDSQSQITGNHIAANGIGVAFLDDAASPVLTGNEIDGNNYGIYLKGFDHPVISGNRIYGNLKFNMVNYSPKSLAIPQNDFHQSDARQVARTIYDGSYNGNCGRLDFMPFIGMAAGPAPSTLLVNAATSPEKPVIRDDDLWSYGRPFDAMKMENLNSNKKQSSDAIKFLALGVMSAASVAILFL